MILQVAGESVYEGVQLPGTLRKAVTKQLVNTAVSDGWPAGKSLEGLLDPFSYPRSTGCLIVTGD